MIEPGLFHLYFCFCDIKHEVNVATWKLFGTHQIHNSLKNYAYLVHSAEITNPPETVGGILILVFNDH